MKKPVTLILTILLALSLAACKNSGNTLPAAETLQGDAVYTSAEDGGQSWQIIDENTDSPYENTDTADTESVDSILVDILATNAYVLNVDTGLVLYQKNSDEHIAPASTAKMLTALTALDYCSLDDIITVGPEIELIASDSSKAGLSRGDKLTVKQLLAALLLPSGNDAAYTLAVSTGRKITGDDALR